MCQITDLFGAPQAPIQPVPQIQALGATQNLGVANNEGFHNNQVHKELFPNQLNNPYPG